VAQPDTEDRHVGTSGSAAATGIGPSASPRSGAAATGPEAPRLGLTVTHDSYNCFIDLTGELDLSTLHVLDDAVADMCRSGHGTTVILGLRRLSFIDCAALGKIVELHHHLRSSGGRVLLFRPPPHVRRLLRLTRLDNTLEVRCPDPGHVATPLSSHEETSRAGVAATAVGRPTV
jgi:anti-anti-sigma factor